MDGGAGEVVLLCRCVDVMWRRIWLGFGRRRGGASRTHSWRWSVHSAADVDVTASVGVNVAVTPVLRWKHEAASSAGPDSDSDSDSDSASDSASDPGSAPENENENVRVHVAMCWLHALQRVTMQAWVC